MDRTERSERRRRFWIQGGFQGRQLVRVFLLELVAVALTALLALVLAFFLVNPSLDIGDGWRHMLVALLIVVLLGGLWLILLGMRAMHRICGPLYRIMNSLEHVRRSGQADPIRLRKDDELHELAEAINATLAALQGKDAAPAPPADADEWSER